jgi:biopolymer transport protein ExbD
MRSTSGKTFITPVDTVTRINVTPIIDVALVLVIILLITAPMLSVTDSSLDLPTSSAQAGDPDLRIFITLARDGALGVDDEVVSPERLEGVVSAKIAEHADERPLVVIRADRAVSHAEVRNLLTVARAAGAPRIAVATRPGELR